MQENEAELDILIAAILSTSREGRILCSFPGIGDILAGQLLAGIGNIDNFETIGKFRAYVGWAPRRSQTGTTYDHSNLDKSGNRLCKQAMHQATIAAIKHSPRWRALHHRLQAKNTKMTSVGHVAGQIAGVIYLLLKQDAELVRSHTGDGPLPEPQLYDIHR
jgi:transposase